MTTPNTVGREPVTIVELEQPRCNRRFGIGGCTATGTPKCYNTFSTCLDPENFDPRGKIRWRFGPDIPQRLPKGTFTDPDDIQTNVIPCLVSVSTSESRLNPGSFLEGQSPFGVTGRVTVNLADIPWNDHVGDFYIADRSWYVANEALPFRADFWALWVARNLIVKDMFLRIYDGYIGQSLGQMRQRVYTLDQVNGPDASGNVTLIGLDPLRLADEEKAQFPRPSDLQLVNAITAAQTTFDVFGAEADLSDTFGTGPGTHLRIGDEIITYNGYTANGDGSYTLTGVLRGQFETTPVDYDASEKIQRCGYYLREKSWRVVDDMLRNHTEMPASFLNLTAWDLEGNTYIPTSLITRLVSEPLPIKDEVGRISQQSLFYIWWGEYEQKVKMLSVRAPEVEPPVLTDVNSLMDGTQLVTDPTQRLTRVFVYYGLRNQLLDEDDPANYNFSYRAIDAVVEDAVGKPVTQIVYAPWVTLRSQAAQVAVRLLIRYKLAPRFLSVQVDAKDRTLTVGDVVDIETAEIVTSEGNIDRTRWQVVSAAELEPGHTYALDLQTYTFLGRFGRYMADGTPAYSLATQEQRDTGGFYADDNGLMSDGSEGYKYQ